jgi:hypothetical protein
MLEDMAPKIVLRPEPYDPDAQDGDGDGIVQERTAWERPAGTRLLQNGAEIVRGSTLPSRPSSLRVVGRDGKDVSYTPTWQRGKNTQSPLADHGATNLVESGMPSLRQIVRTEHENRRQKEILAKRAALRTRNRKLTDARVTSFLSNRKDLSDSDRSKTRAAVVNAAYWGTTFFTPKGFQDLGGVLNDILSGVLDADGNDALSDLRDQYSGLGKIGVQLAMMSLAYRLKASREKTREWTDKTVEFFERQKVAAGEVNERLQRVMRESLVDVLQFFRFGREAADPMEFDADLEKANPPSPIAQAERTVSVVEKVPSGPDKSRWTKLTPFDRQLMERRRDPVTLMMRDTTPEERHEDALEGGMNAWRSSFGQSYMIEEAAKAEFDGDYKESRWAAAIVDEIDKAKPVGKKLFNGEQRTYRVDSRQFDVGETVDFPLISSGATPEIVSGFEGFNDVLGAGDVRGTYISFVNAPGVVFPEAKEREFIQSGEFRVVSVTPYEPDWENKPGHPVGLRGKRKMVTMEYIGPSKQVKVRNGAER